MLLASKALASGPILSLNVKRGVGDVKQRAAKPSPLDPGFAGQFGRGVHLQWGVASVPVAATPGRLLLRRQKKLVPHALQTDALVEESDSIQAVEKMKQLVNQEGGVSEGVDDQELLRFLRAKSLNTELAAKAFVSHQRWRSEFVPMGYFTQAEVFGELDSKKSYWISKDKRGRPALLTLGKNHFYNKKDFDEYKRFIVYAFDTLIRESPPGEDKFICIVDLNGLGLKNLDSKSFIAAFDIMEKHYPGRLDKVFMINVPFIFNGLWKIVQPFIDEETRDRIIFVDKNKLVETLASEIDSEFLPLGYGGEADLVLLQDAFTPNSPLS